MDRDNLDFLISQYHDGELDPLQRQAVAAQLAQDEASRRLLHDHQRVQEALDEWANRLPLVDWNCFHQELQQRLRLCRRTGTIRRRVVRFAAAGLAIAGLLGLLRFSPHGGGPAADENFTLPAYHQLADSEAVVRLVRGASGAPGAQAVVTLAADRDGRPVAAARGPAAPGWARVVLCRSIVTLVPAARPVRQPAATAFVVPLWPSADQPTRGSVTAMANVSFPAPTGAAVRR